MATHDTMGLVYQNWKAPGAAPTPEFAAVDVDGPPLLKKRKRIFVGKEG